MITIVVAIYILRSGIYLNSIFELNMPFLITINKFFGESRFDNMAIGGILAILFYKYPNFKFSTIHKLIIGLSAGYILYQGTNIGFGLDNMVAALVFASLIIWVVNKQKFYILDTSVFLFLGKISYGIYMFHVIGIVLAINAVKFIYPNYDGSGLLSNLLLYSLTMICTLLISYGSFEYLEKRILKYKEKLAN